MKKVILICVLTAVAVFSLVGVALSKQGEDQSSGIWSAINELKSQISALMGRVNNLQAQVSSLTSSALPPPASSTYDGFLRIEGIPGSSTIAGHEGMIEIVSFNDEAGQPHPSEFVITKCLDKSSPLLFLAASSGKHIPTVTIELYQAGGGPKVMAYKFTDVIITKIIDKASPYLYESHGHMEEISLRYSQIRWEYTVSGGTVSAGWDLVENKGL